MSEYDKLYYAKNRIIKRSKWDIWSKTIQGQFTISKNKAKHSNHEWTLTFDQYSELRSKNCFYCSGELPKSSRGLDRIDNLRGYTIDNVVPCCKGCNTLKSDILSKDETVEIVKLLKKLRNRDDIWK